MKEISEFRRQQIKNYKLKNKDKVKEYSKKYYNLNKDRLNEKHIRYYHKNKSNILERQKYYEDNISFNGNLDFVLERDKCCRNCGMTNLQHLDLFNKRLCCHHIDLNKNNNNPNNLVILCRRCHCKIHNDIRKNMALVVRGI